MNSNAGHKSQHSGHGHRNEREAFTNDTAGDSGIFHLGKMWQSPCSHAKSSFNIDLEKFEGDLETLQFHLLKFPKIIQ